MGSRALNAHFQCQRLAKNKAIDFENGLGKGIASVHPLTNGLVDISFNYAEICIG